MRSALSGNFYTRLTDAGKVALALNPFRRRSTAGIAMHQWSPRSITVATLPPRGKSAETFPLIRGGGSVPCRHASAAKNLVSPHEKRAAVLPSVRLNAIA
jgi:hypothetical protein